MSIIRPGGRFLSLKLLAKVSFYPAQGAETLACPFAPPRASAQGDIIFLPKSSTIISEVAHSQPPQPPAGKRTALSRLVVWLVFFLVVTPLYMAVVFILLEWAQVIPHID